MLILQLSDNYQVMNSIKLFFTKLTLEKKASLLILTPILTILMNTRSMLIGLAIIILFDLITGIRKGLHKEKLSFNPLKKYFWQKLHSRGMRLTWRKTYEYGIGILVFATFESMVLGLNPIVVGEFKMSLTEVAVAFASIIEIYSIFENMEAVSGRNMLKKLAVLLPGPFRKLIDKKHD